MATPETVDLGPAHPPKEDSIVAFAQVLPDLQRELVRMRRDNQKHEPEYFAAVEHLEDHELTAFGPEDLTSVRIATSAYGIHLFGKLRIPRMPESGPAYFHIRLFVSGGDEPAKLHSIHTEERDEEDGGKTFRAVFTRNDVLEWFNN